MDRHATIHAGAVYHVAAQPSADGSGLVARGLYAPDAVLVDGQYLPAAVVAVLAAAPAPKQLPAGPPPALPRGNPTPDEVITLFLAGVQELGR